MALLSYNEITSSGDLAQDLHRSGRSFSTDIRYKRSVLITNCEDAGYMMQGDGVWHFRPIRIWKYSYVYYSQTSEKRRKKFASYD